MTSPPQEKVAYKQQEELIRWNFHQFLIQQQAGYMQQQQHQQHQLQQQPQQSMGQWQQPLGLNQPQACSVEHQPLAPAQPDTQITEVWQMPLWQLEPLGPPQPDKRITKYVTNVVISLDSAQRSAAAAA